MDDPNRRKRQNEPPVPTSTNPRYNPQVPAQQQQQQTQQTQQTQQQHQQQQPQPQPQSQQAHPPHQHQQRPLMGAPTERFRPPPLNTAASNRGLPSTGNYSSYYPESGTSFSGSLTQGGLPYQSEYGQDGRQTQGFSGYNAGMIYGVPQTGGQSSVYDNPIFSARQSTTTSSSQIISPEVGESYSPFETTSTPTGGASLPSQSQPTSATIATGYHQQPQVQAFSGNLPSVSGLQHQSQHQPQQQQQQQQPQQPLQPQHHNRQQQQQQHQQPGSSSADVSMEESGVYGAGIGVGEKWGDYHTKLKDVFQNIETGSLASAGETLLAVANWIIPHATELGLHLDNESQFGERIKLWSDFNNAWLALFQKQKDLSESGQGSQTQMTREAMQRMGKELVRLCDLIERHGLVDYEYGVWEEEIMTVLLECVELVDTGEEGSSGNAATAATAPTAPTAPSGSSSRR